MAKVDPNQMEFIIMTKVEPKQMQFEQLEAIELNNAKCNDEYFGGGKHVENYHALRTVPNKLRQIFDRKNELLDEIRSYLFYECKSANAVDLFEKLTRVTIDTIRDVDM